MGVLNFLLTLELIAAEGSLAEFPEFESLTLPFHLGDVFGNVVERRDQQLDFLS